MPGSVLKEYNGWMSEIFRSEFNKDLSFIKEQGRHIEYPDVE